jgi:tetratricopeptide (TPR) repeat protein
MTGALWRSFMVAALFALHPLHVESVAWVSERKDVLSGLFFLLTLGCYGRYVDPVSRVTLHAPRSTLPPALVWYLLSLVMFALGLMSKPMLVTLPFILLLLDYWPLHRTESDTRASRARTLIGLFMEKLPFFALVGASSVVTFIVQQKGGAVSTSLSLGARIANALISYVRYIGKLFWPSDLSMLYPHPIHWPVWQVATAPALLLTICVVVILLGRKQPFLVVGWLWFCGTLVPVIGLVQVGIQSMADRYTYLPLIGLFIALVWGLAEWVPNWPWRAELLTAVGVLVLSACALLATRQIGLWRNSETLFGHAVKVTRGNYLAYNNLGYYLNNQGRTTEAMVNYREALKINPAYEDALNNLGYALAGQKRFVEAIPLYEAALRVRPNHVEVHNNLGNALSEIGQIEEAIKHYLVVLKQKPDHADANNNLGIALAMQGKLEEAVPHFLAALRANPKYASAHSNLGNAFAVQHKLDEAIREYREALRLKPEDAQAHNNIGNALLEQGQVGEAVGHYREALRLNADNPEAHFNLGLALLRQGNRDEAVAHFIEALRLRPNYVEARKQMEALAAGPK